MTDIHNNIGADNIKKVSSMSFEGTKISSSVQKNYSDKEIDDLNKDHSALVGRSMIKKHQKVEKTQAQEVHFDGKTVENIKSDLAELNANPALIKKANAVFEGALKKGYSYQQASAIAREFADSYK